MNNNLITFDIKKTKLSYQFFPSHLVDRSLWPLMVSSSLFALVIGTVQYFHGYSTGFILLKAATLLTIIGSVFWWKDVVVEAAFKGNHTKKVRIGIAQGFNLFIISEIMAFLSVFWAYLHSSLSPAIEIGGCWPPVGITPLNAFALPFINTLILLSSGGFITYAHHALIANNRKAAMNGLFITIILALVFTFFQYIEYNQAGFTFADSVFGSAFFATTGLHGLHVLIGTIFIFVQYLRITNYHMTNEHHLGLELSILYWHFVDVVWLFCAPLWILDGSGKPREYYLNSIALLNKLIDYAILVATTLSKSTNLSDSEMDRGVKHVGKAGIKVNNLLHSDLRDKVDHGHNILFSGTPQTPFSIANLIIMQLNGNVNCIVVIITLYLIKKYKEQCPKFNKSIEESIKGFPKGSNSYGNGALIVGNKKGSHIITKVGQRMYSTSTLAANKEKLSGGELLSKLRVRDGKYFDLYKILCDEDFLFGAYHSIKSKPGNMTEGVDKETFDGISKDKFKNLSEELRSERFKFKPSKRVFIHKTNGKTRPLGIPSPIDKIVQKAMAILLELVFETTFSNNSHGFRPNRGTHTALRQIAQWSGSQWAIEGDIKGFFDNVDHHILAKFLSNKISDQQFIDLYWKLVRAGYIEEGVKNDSFLGVPQGGIVSPILSNIYLHHFDLFMEKLIEKHHSNVKDITKRNPVYDKITRKLQTLRDKNPNVIERNDEVNKEIKKLIKQRRTIPSRFPNGIRLRYVRYADDWVVGYYGNLELIKNILTQIQEFLVNELKIELGSEKIKITNLLKDKGKFLGFYFIIHKPKESKFTIRNKLGISRKTKISHNRMWLLAPVTDLLNKLNNEGFLKNYKPGSKIIPQAKSNWIYLTHHSILSQYNWLSRGLLNYYSIANNRYIFHLIINFILKHSCAKTLGRKFNLGSRKKVFSKFGKELETKTEPKLKFHTESDYKLIPFLQWPKHTKLKNPFDFLKWTLRTQHNFWDPCWICGSNENIELHHVKHIRKSNYKTSGFTTIMSKLNRKQIPVCSACHDKIHNGTYDGISLKQINKSK